MGLIRKPCLTCGVLIDSGSRCETCRLERERKRDAQRGPRTLYSGDYKRRAREVRQNAVQCWICGGPARESDPWTADHIYPGQYDSPLAAAHKSCNSARGNKPFEWGRNKPEGGSKS